MREEWKKDLEAVIEAMATADVFYQKVYIIDFVEMLLDEQRHELTRDKVLKILDERNDMPINIRERIIEIMYSGERMYHEPASSRKVDALLALFQSFAEEMVAAVPERPVVEDKLINAVYTGANAARTALSERIKEMGINLE